MEDQRIPPQLDLDETQKWIREETKRVEEENQLWEAELMRRVAELKIRLAEREKNTSKNGKATTKTAEPKKMEEMMFRKPASTDDNNKLCAQVEMLQQELTKERAKLQASEITSKRDHEYFEASLSHHKANVSYLTLELEMCKKELADATKEAE